MSLLPYDAERQQRHPDVPDGITYDGMMQALLRSTHDSFCFMNLEGRIVFASNACKALAHDYTDDLVGKTYFDFLSREQAEVLRKEDLAIMATGVPVSDSIQKRQRPDETELWVSVTRTPWKNASGEIEGIISICRETSARVEKEKYVLSMLSIATHDIRAPLVAIGSTVKLLMRGAFGSVDESVKVTLSDLSARIGCLETMVGEYLCKSSLMSLHTPEKEDFDLRQDIIDPILDEYAAEIEKNKLCLDNTLGAIPGNRIIIKANAGWIKIVYRNLIRNAIKYAGSGYIAFGFEDNGDHYKLNVYNSGPPIPEPRKAKIFEQYESKHSTGLGLSISRGLIRKHGGDMWYENTWDNHPNFVFTIPK